ncbi:MAG: NADP-dependent isocitrate dehydrogenase, partial [Acidimicrobiales bacterium]
GQGETAARVHNAWLRTIEDGVHTYDIYDPSVSTTRVGTLEFADAVIARLGYEPTTLRSVSYPTLSEPITVEVASRPRARKELVGVDVFVEWLDAVESLAKVLEAQAGPDLGLVMISNRGQKVYPGGVPETFCVDHWRCRFQAGRPGDPVTFTQVIELLGRLAGAGLPFVKTEGLFTFDGEPGFSLGQGQ